MHSSQFLYPLKQRGVVVLSFRGSACRVYFPTKTFPHRRTLLYGIHNHSYAGVDGLKLLASGGVPEEVKEKSDAMVSLIPAQKRQRSREMGSDDIQKVRNPFSF